MESEVKAPEPVSVEFRVQHFRAFRDEVALRLRPLTLVYGKNNAGKSSLVRVLPLLADSLHRGTAGLDLGSGSLRGATYKELGWLGPDPSLNPWFTIVLPDGTIFRLQLSQDGSSPIVNNVVLGVRGDASRFKVSFAGRETKGAITDSRYEGKWRGAAWAGSLGFGRLIPSGVPDEAAALLSEIESHLAPVKGLQWLHADRLVQGGSTPSAARLCAADGSDLADRLSNRDDVIAKASLWLEHSPLRERVRLGTDGSGKKRFELERPNRERMPLHLAGEGVQCLLPILLCAAWADCGGGPTAMVVEEPESHLHPDMQVALVDRLLETAKAGIPVVLETHSVYFLRAMALAVLDGRLRNDDVALHWVEQDERGVAAVREVPVTPDGTLKGWRPDAFEQEQTLARRILEERWRIKGRHP